MGTPERFSVGVLFQLSPNGFREVKSRGTVPDRESTGLKM